MLPQVAKLSRCLQAEKLDLTAISGLVDSTLQTLHESLLPAAHWVLELLDAQDELQAIAIIDSESITSFQDKVAKPFVTDLKENISRRFSSQDIVASFSIFDSSKLPQKDSPDLSSYGDEFLGVLEDHYGTSSDSRKRCCSIKPHSDKLSRLNTLLLEPVSQSGIDRCSISFFQWNGVKKCSTGSPFSSQRKQRESSSIVDISVDSSAITL